MKVGLSGGWARRGRDRDWRLSFLDVVVRYSLKVRARQLWRNCGGHGEISKLTCAPKVEMSVA